MHIKTLAPKTKAFLDQISGKSFLDQFYLSGGTALALHLGHRESEDLDFFTKSDFDPVKLQIELENITKLSSVEQDKGTLNCHAGDVQLQFLCYPYNLLNDTTAWNQIHVSSIEDIACTKLLTISSRGSKKDFIDMYFILKQYSLKELFNLLQKKYPKTDYNQIHILKSLVYFDDADNQGMPRMHIDLSWDTVKSSIVKTVKSFRI
jgi:predicted nucleotidyltransferase component of viral defense system